MDEQCTIDTCLHACGEELVARTFAIGLPIVDGGFAVFDGDEIVLCKQTIFAKRGGEG